MAAICRVSSVFTEAEPGLFMTGVVFVYQSKVTRLAAVPVARRTLKKGLVPILFEDQFSVVSRVAAASFWDATESFVPCFAVTPRVHALKALDLRC